MFLEKIEIQGFKSFAEPTTLLFNRTLTAVVGPNGSGKSNIADAIRWVLGEQSLKLLRGKKSDDVIFAGSDNKGRLGFARVAIHLNNADGRAAIDYEQVSLERTVDRSGESSYTLNGRPARLIDIQLLLARAAVGQKSYSVIGQGTIDRLLTITPAERRDFFDEATGVRQFQMKKNQALLKLEHTEENLAQAELVLQELEPRLRTLTRQVKRLERKETLERELHDLQTQYYSYLTTELDGELGELSGKREKIEKETAQLAASLAAVQRSIDEHERAKSRDDRFRELQDKLFHIQKEYNTLTKKKILVEGAADIAAIKAGGANTVFANQRAEELGNAIASLKQEEKTLAHTIKTAADRIATLSKETRTTETRLANLEALLTQGTQSGNWEAVATQASALAHEHQAIHATLAGITSVDELTAFRASHRTFTDRLHSFLQTLQNRTDADHTRQWDEFKKLKAEHTTLVTRLHEADAARAVSERERELVTARIAEYTTEQHHLAARADATSKTSTASSSAGSAPHTDELAAIERDLADKETTMKTIRADLDSFNEHEEKTKQELMGLQKQFRTIQYDQTIKNNELTSLKVEIAKFETRKEELMKEISYEGPQLKLSRVTDLNVTHTKELIDTAKRQLAIIGGIDTETVNEYKEVNEKYTFLSQQTTDLRQAQKSLNTLIDELDEHVRTQFEAGFKHINVMFSKYFRKLFNGGHAKLVLQMLGSAEATADAETGIGPAVKNAPSDDDEYDEDDDEEDGNASETTGHGKKTRAKKTKSLDYTVEISATPPGKKLANIAMLSGGEKALTAIALIAAIIAQNPPPFVVLDEVDAALDEANSIRFAEIIAELTDRTQFVTITHNRATMHHANILYGVTMGDDGVSKLLSVNFDEAEKYTKS